MFSGEVENCQDPKSAHFLRKQLINTLYCSMTRLDHILIYVTNLQEAVADFNAMGFVVNYGTKPEKAYNAMVFFDDESFIELVDTSKIPVFVRLLAKTGILSFFNPFYNRIGNYSLSSGTFLDFACYSAAILNDFYRIRKNFGVSKILSLSRVNTLGEKLSWQLFAPKTSTLPFIMSDYFPYKYADKALTKHFNNTKGIAEIEIEFSESIAIQQQTLANFYGLQEFQTQADSIQFVLNNLKISYKKGKTDRITGIKLHCTYQNYYLPRLFSKYGIRI